MEFIRVQFLVYDDVALNKFRIDHGIPEDVHIDRFGPNKDANLVDSNRDRILVQILLIHRARL